jgi:replication-associated recombination protein RarA
LYWGWEIGSTSPNHAARLWSRLLIIVSEDIGLADMHIGMEISRLNARWKERKNSDDNHLYYMDAVGKLTQANKSRLIDHAIHALEGEYQLGYPAKPIPAEALDPVELEKLRREIPDFALDKHTMRGKKMGRGTLHFYEEGTKLANCTVPDPFAKRAKEADLMLEAGKRARTPD